jgi:hypothetical protein
MLITGISSIYQPQPERAGKHTLDIESQNSEFTELKLEENSNLGLGDRIFNVFNRLAAYSRFITGAVNSIS